MTLNLFEPDPRSVKMRDPLPMVLVPGLRCSARLYLPQIPELWQFGPVTVGNHTVADSLEAIAQDILTTAPPRFALIGLSMGGYLAFEILRRAPERVAKLALLDTSARPDTPEQTQRREQQIALARAGRYEETVTTQFSLMVHPSRRADRELWQAYRLMAQETGPDVFLRHQQAIRRRIDSRPDLARVKVPTLVLVGDCDEMTPPAHAEEIAAGIEGAHLVVVADCGHLSTLERPQAVTAALVDLMAR
jgi:pimeloyl-ACP methyl ester carboxylesterase